MNWGIIHLLGLTSSLFLAMAPGVLAQSQRGWRAWQPVTESLPFQAGFSNTELGGYLEYKDTCKQQANASGHRLAHWYRLNDLVFDIGTGKVEYGCQIGGQFVTTYRSRAVQNELDGPVCLRVQSDVGNGLRVRQAPRISSRQVGTLNNDEEVFYSAPPALIITDSNGRQWIQLQRDRLNSWASLAAGEREHVNFRLCSPQY